VLLASTENDNIASLEAAFKLALSTDAYDNAETPVKETAPPSAV